MAFVARHTITFLCDMMRYAGFDPASALCAVDLAPESELPELIPAEAATRFVHEVVRAGRIGSAFEATEALRMRSGFLAILSHELRTPLNGVVGFADALSSTELSPTQRDLLAQLRASADSMSAVIDDLMALSETQGDPPRMLIPPPIDEPTSRERISVRPPPAIARSAREGDEALPRALVVDDIAANRIVASKLMERMGFEVDTASNGSEAVEALRKQTYSLVLMDCLMPVMDGYDAARMIREYEDSIGRRTPIVAVSANALAQDRDRCFESGMDDFVAKPLRGAVLETVIFCWCAHVA